ncbi:glycerophosphodiester phosphodiesterase [Nocardioides aestuarii]|uniref:Glycerophosphodiester phosphodiesterase family protein n=1 Tax=Nocardioides aestuarii TaxID=252231 RepID=A0ABW4TPY5_9ACTN
MTEPTGHAYLDAVPPPLAFAHRGGATHPDLLGLENTMTAFRHAHALGYTHLETDVHATRDGVLLAFHDSVLDRVTDQRGSVEDLILADVRRARIGPSEQVPTLAELFDALPAARFNIDLKSDAAVPLLARFVDEREVHERLLVGSFSHRRLRRFRRLTGGRVATSASPVEVAAYLALPVAVAERVTGGEFAAFQVPHRRGPLVVSGRRLVRRAHAADKHVHSWTIDDPAEMIELLDRGVDGLMTDRTDILKDVLAARGQWRGRP